MTQSEEYETYSRNINGQQHFKRELEARGNEVKTIFTSRIKLYSTGLDVGPSNSLIRRRGCGNWSQVPTCLERYAGGDDEEDSFWKNGKVRLNIHGK